MQIQVQGQASCGLLQVTLLAAFWSDKTVQRHNFLKPIENSWLKVYSAERDEYLNICSIFAIYIWLFDEYLPEVDIWWIFGSGGYLNICHTYLWLIFYKCLPQVEEVFEYLPYIYLINISWICASGEYLNIWLLFYEYLCQVEAVKVMICVAWRKLPGLIWWDRGKQMIWFHWFLWFDLICWFNLMRPGIKMVISWKDPTTFDQRI